MMRPDSENGARMAPSWAALDIHLGPQLLQLAPPPQHASSERAASPAKLSCQQARHATHDKGNQ